MIPSHGITLVPKKEVRFQYFCHRLYTSKCLLSPPAFPRRPEEGHDRT